MTDLLVIHRALLDQRRLETNLVGPGPVDEHYLDAERGLAGLAARGRWADLGSGAGFPGIVLAALFPELQVDLVEPRRKRADFLREVLAAAGSPPRLRVLQARAQTLPGPYDGICSRALAAPNATAALAAPLLRAGGALVLFLQAEQPMAPDPRFSLLGEVTYEVPGRPPRRSLRLLRRDGDARGRRPR